MYNVIVRRIKCKKHAFDKLVTAEGNNNKNLCSYTMDAEMYASTEGIETDIYHFMDERNAMLQFEEERRRCITIKGTFHYTFTEVKVIETSFKNMACTCYNEVAYLNSIEEEIDKKGYFA